MSMAIAHNTSLNEADRAILHQVDKAIDQGKNLLNWWNHSRQTNSLRNRFPISRHFHIHSPKNNYSFLENAVLQQGVLPVAGVIQDQLYDFRRFEEPMWLRDQVKEFMLHYFMRTNFALNLENTRRLDLYDSDAKGRQGWGYEQCYYKLAANSEIGKFSEQKRYQTTDLREIGNKYEWIVYKINIFYFDMSVNIAGLHGPKLIIPKPQDVYAVLTPEFIVNNEYEGLPSGVIGEYGYGYSVVPNPNQKTLFAAGPSRIQNTIETLCLRVFESGEIRAHMDFITPQPPRIIEFEPVKWGFQLADRLSLGISSSFLKPVQRLLEDLAPQIDPIYAGIWLLNLMTAGLAKNALSISKEQLFKQLMILHFADVYHMYNLSASHFKRVPDWTDEQNIPEWAKRGIFNPKA